MKPLPHTDHQHLEAAEGWLGLKNCKEANEELEKITPKLRAHPYVLEMRYKIYEAAGKWEMALEVAEALKRILPENQWGYFYTAFALHELKRTQEAYDVLKAVIAQFPEHQFMHYNLACYSCQLGKMEEAMAWLEKSIDLGTPMPSQSMSTGRRCLAGNTNRRCHRNKTSSNKSGCSRTAM